MFDKIYKFKGFEPREFNYLYEIKKDCFKWYVEKIYGEWNDGVQIQFFKDEIGKHLENVKVITYNGEAIGLFINYINENNNRFIELFFIDKKHQGKGIGTDILEKQLEQDKKDKIDTLLQVFKENPARFLYQRVGFQIYEETETHYKMIRKVDGKE